MGCQMGKAVGRKRIKAETIQEQFQWLLEHPEEEAKYEGEFIAVADGRIVAHGKNSGKVLDQARRLGYEPLIGHAYGGQTIVLSTQDSFGLPGTDVRQSANRILLRPAAAHAEP